MTVLSSNERRRRLLDRGRIVECRYCGAQIRAVQVLVGREQRSVPLMIDCWPHPDGEVIRRENDGKYRMLSRGARARAGLAAFRVHTQRACQERARQP